MQEVKTSSAPEAIGAYAQAVIEGSMVFTSGQLGMDPSTMELKSGVEDQTRQALANLKAVLEAAGTGPSQAIKCTIFLNDMSDFGMVNAIYGDFFANHRPARSCVQAAGLPKGALVEIECIAAITAK